MNYDLQPWDGARALCSAGVLRAVSRAGFPPKLWKEENDLELMFEAPGVVEDFRIMVGPVGASDLRIARGTALELSYGHLREDEPQHWADTCAEWRVTPELDAQWAVGARLARPVRLEMTNPYVETVGFAFDCERDGEMIGRLLIFASADILFAVREGHPEAATYGLRERVGDI